MQTDAEEAPSETKRDDGTLTTALRTTSEAVVVPRQRVASPLNLGSLPMNTNNERAASVEVSRGTWSAWPPTRRADLRGVVLRLQRHPS
jgi:hypothetical protein